MVHRNKPLNGNYLQLTCIIVSRMIVQLPLIYLKGHNQSRVVFLILILKERQ